MEVVGFPREIAKCDQSSLHNQDKRDADIFYHLSPPDFNFSERGYGKGALLEYILLGFIGRYLQYLFQRVIIFSMKSHSLLINVKCQLYLRWL